MIQTKRLVDFFFQCVRIPSPSFMENRFSQFLYQHFLKKADEVILDKRTSGSNLIIRFNGNPAKKGISLCAHLDTVEDGIRIIDPILDGNLIWAKEDTILGADNKAAIAVFTEAMETALDKKLDVRPVDLIFTFGEEKHLSGVKELDLSLIRYPDVILMDSTGDIGGIIESSPTHYTFKITVSGKRSHAGIEPEKGENAILDAAKILAVLPQGRLDESTTFNIGMIRGGEATNIVPDKAVIEGEFRSTRKERIAELVDRLVKLNFQGQKIQVDLTQDYKGYELAPENPLVRQVQESMKETGIPSFFLRSGGGSDANILREKGFNAVNLASGMTKPHSFEECIALDSLIQGSELILSLLQKG